MVAFKTHLDVIEKFTWIGKTTYNVIKYGLTNTLNPCTFLLAKEKITLIVNYHKIVQKNKFCHSKQQ